MVRIVREGQGFSAFEHKALGQRAFMIFMAEFKLTSEGKRIEEPNEIDTFLKERGVNRTVLEVLQQGKQMGPDISSTLAFPFGEKNKFSALPGEITALGGDFFGPIKQEDVISDVPDGITGFIESVRRFDQHYNSLALHASDSELKALRECFKVEGHRVEQAIIKCKSATEGMKDKDVPTTGTYASITRYHKWLLEKSGMLSSRYMDLLRYNHDHFEKEALKTFRAGYESAILAAKKAHEAYRQARSFSDLKEADVFFKEASKYLLEAITKMLFAGHFLTDYFASGHIRTPRLDLSKILHKKSSQFMPGLRVDIIAGLLSHEMHDEDGYVGLYFKSKKHPEPWLAKGDSCLFDPSALKAVDIIVEALALALADIELVFQGQAPSKEYENCLPEVVNGMNHLPLFIVRRDDRGDPMMLLRRKELNYKVSRDESLDIPEFSEDKFYQEELNPVDTLHLLEKAKYWRQAEISDISPEEAAAVLEKWLHYENEAKEALECEEGNRGKPCKIL